MSAGAAQWGAPSEGWDDFKFGLIEGHRAPFEGALKAAVADGIQIDYSYVYLTTPNDVEGFLFAPWFNYAKTRPGTVRPSVTIYMLAGGSDSEAAIIANAADATFMKSYFTAIAAMADSCKGTKPIYVIEPDAWGYLLIRAGSYRDQSDANFSKTCHINDLGLSWLSEFSNTIADLPMAIIKTLKTVDPDCYCGILAASWGFTDMPDVATAIGDAENTGRLYNKWLREPWRGDFIGIEKNGCDAGAYGTGSGWFWNDTKNADYVTWCKSLGQTVDLPLFGWQISIGYQHEDGYEDLPNTPGRCQDTYFPYFFKHVDDFVAAGIIGYDAGCNNQGNGTWYSLKAGEGDNGWFLNQLKTFNASRPYDLQLGESSVLSSRPASAPSMRTTVTDHSIRISGLPEGTSVGVYDLRGTLLRQHRVAEKTTVIDARGLSRGAYVLRANRLSTVIQIGR
jgi:hypothetical protein